jgi:hypothetical protein
VRDDGDARAAGCGLARGTTYFDDTAFARRRTASAALVGVVQPVDGLRRIPTSGSRRSSPILGRVLLPASMPLARALAFSR